MRDSWASVRLVEFAQEQYTKIYGGSLLASFWGHRFCRIAEWFVQQERKRSGSFDQSWLEVTGQIHITPEFVLTAKADRIDQSADATLHIIDYKTGMVPSNDDIRKGYSSQLALETLIAQQGGFSEVASTRIANLSFWQLTGRSPAGVVKTLKETPEVLAQEAAEGVLQLIRTFADPFTPYQSCPIPRRAPIFSDYTHLARVAEWSQGGADGS